MAIGRLGSALPGYRPRVHGPTKKLLRKMRRLANALGGVLTSGADAVSDIVRFTPRHWLGRGVTRKQLAEELARVRPASGGISQMYGYE